MIWLEPEFYPEILMIPPLKLEGIEDESDRERLAKFGNPNRQSETKGELVSAGFSGSA